jgi:hypothetical protein
MSTFVAIALGFFLGATISWLLHRWAGQSIAEMRKVSLQLAEEAREIAEGSERVNADIDRRMTDLLRAKTYLEDRWGGSIVRSAIEETKHGKH